MAAQQNRRTSRAGRHGRRYADGARRTPGWVMLLSGLALGALAVAGAYYIRDRLAARSVAPAAGLPLPKPASKPKVESDSAPPEKHFGFYEMLPNFEVVVPEEDRDVRPDLTPQPLDTPGVYVLQAGSYATFGEADRVKAQLALLGISSQIQKITVDEREYNRVRIGPIEDLNELNRVRKRLRDARIDVLVIRVGE